MINRSNKPIDHADVDSSSIKTIGYDNEAKELHVTFHDTGRYVYHNVPPSVHEGLMMSGSKGQFIHQQIKNRFGFTRL